MEAGPDGGYSLGEERIEDGLTGIMRQLEATVFLDAVAARELHDWLGQKLSEFEKMIADAKTAEGAKETTE